MTLHWLILALPSYESSFPSFNAMLHTTFTMLARQRMRL